MARTSIRDSRKFKRLVHALQIPTPHVLGYLEMLWQSAHVLASPEIRLDDVEIEAQWAGEPGELVRVLVDHGWLDPIDDDTVEIHDYWEHCPKYVRDRAAYRQARKREPEPERAPEPEPDRRVVPMAKTDGPSSIASIVSAMGQAGDLVDAIVAFEPKDQRARLSKVWRARLEALERGCGQGAVDKVWDLVNEAKTRAGPERGWRSKGYSSALSNPAAWLNREVERIERTKRRAQ